MNIEGFSSRSAFRAEKKREGRRAYFDSLRVSLLFAEYEAEVERCGGNPGCRAKKVMRIRRAIKDVAARLDGTDYE